MTDIVERLQSSLQLHGPHLLRNADIAEAAAEIERLRTEIEHLRTTLGYLADNINEPALVAIAEAALKPKP